MKLHALLSFGILTSLLLSSSSPNGGGVAGQDDPPASTPSVFSPAGAGPVAPPTAPTFDCGQFGVTSCETCSSNPGCVWCGVGADCESAETLAATGGGFDSTTSCMPVDYVNTEQCNADSVGNFFPDPLYSGQSWVYNLINVLPVWESGITGAGITIRVNDDGVDANHPDLSGKFDVASSCVDSYLPLDPEGEDSHGTSCASIAAADANDVCSAGIAPGASVSGCRVIDGAPEDESVFYYAPEGGDMDISSNSFGSDGCKLPENFRRRLQIDCPFSPDGFESPCAEGAACQGTDWGAPVEDEDCREEIKVYCECDFIEDVAGCTEYLYLFVPSCSFNTLSPTESEGLIKGVTEGRNGKGVVHVMASGNEYTAGDNVNYQGFANTRLTISVGGVDKAGVHAPYSVTGSAIFVSAPGGNTEKSKHNHIVARAGGTGCSDAGEGTSFATPVVSGVVALILEANPNLSWRDVQGVLAATSTQTDPTDESWTVNAAGFHHSPKYGFGLVNAFDAVEAAKSWTYFSQERSSLTHSGVLDLILNDNKTMPTSSTMNVNKTGILIESTVLYLNLSHPSRGDLKMTLTSPDGTSSELVPGYRPESGQVANENWKLMTVRAWGEQPSGNWTLDITDVKAGDTKDCVNDPTFAFMDDLTCEAIDQLYPVFCNEDGSEGPDFAEAATELGVSSIDEVVGVDVACCACGGGTPASDIEDVLRSWSLQIFGHDDPDFVSEAPITATPNTMSPVGSSEAPVTIAPVTTSPVDAEAPITTAPTTPSSATPATPLPSTGAPVTPAPTPSSALATCGTVVSLAAALLGLCCVGLIN